MYNINWVGHNYNGEHDKVWGWLKFDDGRIYCFWGRRGKKLRFKQHESEYSVHKIQDEKEYKKEYARIEKEQYNNLVKDFLDDVEIWCATAILSDSVM